MNLVFLLYIMLFSVCDRCDIFVVPSGSDESSIFIVYYVFSVCDRCDIFVCRQKLMNLVFLCNYVIILSL